MSVDWIPWIVFGGVAALTGSSGSGTTPRRERQLLALPVALAALIGIVTTRSAVEANYAAQASARSRDPGFAVTAAAAAVRLDPGRARYWNQLGFAYDQRKQWRQSGSAYEEATTRAPYNASYWANLLTSRLRLATASEQASRGSDPAFRAARRAVEVDPNNPVGHVALAQVANAFGQHELALQEMLTAIRLYRGDSSYDLLIAEAALRDGSPESARRIVEEILGVKESATLRVVLARLALKLNDAVAARRNAERALELDPNNIEAKRLVSETNQ